MSECNTCLEKEKTISCSNDKCEWEMCYSCAERWYEYHTLCPACRTPQKKHYNKFISFVENIICLKIVVFYTIILSIMMIIGRFCALLFKIGPTDILCDGDIDLCTQTMLTGAMIFMLCSAIIASLISIFIFIINTLR